MKNFEVMVPSQSLKLMIELVKKASKIVKNTEYSMDVLPDGLYADVFGSTLVVPVQISFRGEAGFRVMLNDVLPLLKTDGRGVLFQIGTEPLKAEEGTPPVNPNWRDAVMIYTERGVTKRQNINCFTDLLSSIERVQYPEKVIESVKFLPAFAWCSPYCKQAFSDVKHDESIPTNRLCIEDNQLVAIDRCAVINLRSLDFEELTFDLSVSKALPKGRFLLDDYLFPLFPKTQQVVRLGSFTETYKVPRGAAGSGYERLEEKKRTILYLGFSEYAIFTPGLDGAYCDWRKYLVLRDDTGRPYSIKPIKIDRADARVCLEKLPVLPKTCDRALGVKSYVLVKFDEDGRLCIQSGSFEKDNVQLRFSAKTTGAGIPSDNLFAVKLEYLETMLRLGLETAEDPITVRLGYTSKPSDGSILFESDTVGFLMMLSDKNHAFLPITSVVDLSDHWHTAKTKKASKKNGGLVEALQLELSKLKEENEQLRRLKGKSD